jgi:hypothetical protein
MQPRRYRGVRCIRFVGQVHAPSSATPHASHRHARRPRRSRPLITRPTREMASKTEPPKTEKSGPSLWPALAKPCSKPDKPAAATANEKLNITTPETTSQARWRNVHLRCISPLWQWGHVIPHSTSPKYLFRLKQFLRNDRRRLGSALGRLVSSTHAFSPVAARGQVLHLTSRGLASRLVSRPRGAGPGSLGGLGGAFGDRALPAPARFQGFGP